MVREGCSGEMREIGREREIREIQLSMYLAGCLL